MFRKEEYLEAFVKMSEFLDIVEEGCGESFWIPPGWKSYMVCDMGYVYDFWRELERYFLSEESDCNTRPISNLLQTERVEKYIKKYGG